jgi:hypothetical protein
MAQSTLSEVTLPEVVATAQARPPTPRRSWLEEVPGRVSDTRPDGFNRCLQSGEGFTSFVPRRHQFEGATEVL